MAYTLTHTQHTHTHIHTQTYVYIFTHTHTNIYEHINIGRGHKIDRNKETRKKLEKVERGVKVCKFSDVCISFKKS